MTNVDPAVRIAEDPETSGPGTSLIYTPGPRFRRYKLTYILAGAGIAAIWGGIGSVLLAFQVQDISFAETFTGANAGVNLTDLTNLKAAVAAGTATPTADQQQQLVLLGKYDSARAAGLGMIATMSIAVGMFVSPIVGALSDRTRSRWGRRAPWIAIGAILGALLLVAARYSPTVGVLLVAYTAAQVALGLAPGPLNATVPDRVPADTIGSMSALTGFGTLVGGALGIVAAGNLFAALGLNAYFPFILAAIAFPLLFLLVSPDRSSKNLHVPTTNKKQFLLSFTIAVRDRDYRLLLIAKLVMLFGYAISTTFSVYMLQSYIQPALSAEQAAKTVPLLTVTGLPGMIVALLVSGWLSDKFKRRKPFVIAASLLFAASLVAPLVSATLPALFVQTIVGAMALGAFLTVDQAYFIDLLPDPTAAARDLGISTFMQNIGQAAGPAVAGLVVVATGGYQMVWLVALIAVLIAAVIVVPIRRAR